MTDIDNAIYKACQMEKASRIKYFLENTELIYANAGFVDSKYKVRLNKLKKKIEETNRKMNNIIRIESKKLQNGDDGFDLEAHKKKISAIYPELSDPRCYKHEMRPVPVEKFNLLLTNANKEGALTYLNERYKVPPAQRYYFPALSSWDYGWRPPPPGREDFYGRTYALKNFMWRVNGIAPFQHEKQIPAITY